MRILLSNQGRGFFLLGLILFSLFLSACGGGLQGDGTRDQGKGNTSQSTTHSSTMPGGLTTAPAHLLIPSISVNAPIESVGISSDGTLATPVNNPWDSLGWYSAGPLPGNTGSAVIDGHLDRPGGTPAVFWNLKKLQIGDQVTVVDATGKTLRFHVDRLETYTPQDAPADEIFGDTSGRFLNLITCAGTWIPDQHQTTERFVVYTSLET